MNRNAFDKKSDNSNIKSGFALYACVFTTILLLYGLTAQNGPAWQDSGIFQWRILNFDLTGWMGVALAHPLLIVLGKVFSWVPLGEVMWRMNMVSAVAGAFATSNLVMLVWRLSEQTRASAASGLIAGAFFSLAHTVWWLATICESQMIYAALLTVELHLLVTLLRQNKLYWVLLLGFANGLALTAHNFALLALPAYVAVIIYLISKHRIARLGLLLLICGWIIGASGYIALIINQTKQTGLFEAVHSALFGASWEGEVTGFSSRAIIMGTGYVLYNLPNLTLPLAGIGAWTLRKRLPYPLYWTLIYLTSAYLLFAIRYAVPDQFMFFVPFYVMTAVLAGLGIDIMIRSKRRLVIYTAALSIIVAPTLYTSAPVLWRSLNMPLPGRKDLPFRDPYRYWLVPWKTGEDSAGKFARAALEQPPPEGIIIADGTSYYPLLITRRLENTAKDVRILLSGQANPKNVPPGTPDVFIVSDLSGYHPEWMDKYADFRKYDENAPLLHVVWHDNKISYKHK